MKINPTQNTGLFTNYRVNKIYQAESNDTAGSLDKVSLSEDGLNFSKALSEVKNEVQLRSPEELQRINDIKEQIRQGTYRVDSEKIAEKMLLSVFSE